MEQQTHKRRVRYKGTHPRTYQEKYKELNPEKYKDTIEHVIQKGNTPAGMHLSICVKEILDFLQIRPGQTGLDATLGYGGHSTEMLKCLEGRGHLYALDVDPIEIEKTKRRLAERGFAEDILSIKQMNFANVKELLPESGKFDFVLADLGVSSMQIDNPERGFSYKFDGPLDLRLDPQKGVPASERLREMSRDEIAGMLIENADEPYAEEIAKAISIQQKKKPIRTTTDLREVIEKALSFLPKAEQKEAVKKSSQRSFQALRIDVNESTISRFLSGKTEKLSEESVIRIARVFNVSTDFILGTTVIPDKKNYDISELGLSVEAAKNLYTGKVNNDVVNRLLENPRFAMVTYMIAQYMDDTLARGYAAQNQMFATVGSLLLGQNQTPEAVQAARTANAMKVPTYQADQTTIQNTFMTVVKEIKKEAGSDLAAARAI